MEEAATHEPDPGTQRNNVGSGENEQTAIFQNSRNFPEKDIRIFQMFDAFELVQSKPTLPGGLHRAGAIAPTCA